MKEDDKMEVADVVEQLVKRAASCRLPNEALGYSQAALNVAHALNVAKMSVVPQQPRQPK